MELKKLYKASTLFGNIQIVEVIKETDSTVTLQNGRRENKKSSGNCFFETPEEAKTFLIKDADEDIIQAERRLQNAKDKRISLLEKLNTWTK